MNIKRKELITELQQKANRERFCSQVKAVDCMKEGGVALVEGEEVVDLQRLVLFPDGVAKEGRKLVSAIGDMEWVDRLIEYSKASRMWNFDVPAYLVDSQIPAACAASLNFLLDCKVHIVRDVVQNFIWIIDGGKRTVLVFGYADSDDDIDYFEAHLYFLEP